MHRRYLYSLISIILLAVVNVATADDGRVDFHRDIRPILSDKCYHCHGPDDGQRQADLRLDLQEGAIKLLDEATGMHIVAPGDVEHSELYRRITSDDEFEQMPPPESKLSLTPQEVETIRLWIEQGAEWTDHWSFIPLADVAFPEVNDVTWPINEIDHFVLARLEAEGLAPSPQADKATLLRRLSFDLTGLPPTLEELDAFLADDSPDAYEHAVDRLLASPHFGERMTVDWLDVARYADTFGYQSDVYRDMWPWRDWVVEAFNSNLPYDDFITWQLAGDLLPDATREQILATAFNRNHRQTNEGGSVEEEFRCEYVADRVNTLGAAFLGLTLECCRCHSHKYDPITQTEYYQLGAFLNNIDESGLYSHFTNAVPTPTLLLPNEAQQQQIDISQAAIAAAEAELATYAAQQQLSFEEWLSARPSEAVIPGLVGDYGFDELVNGQAVNRVNADLPGQTSEGPVIVPGRVGNALALSGENNVTFALGGDFDRNHTFSISLWMLTPDVKDRAVVFHRSQAWTDAGSRGYELLIEEGRLSAALIHFWPGNAIRIWANDPLPVNEWVHVVWTYDGSSRADGLKLYINGALADCDVVRDVLYKNITGGGADKLTIGQRFRDRGFKDGLVDEFHIYNRELTSIESAHVYDGAALTELLTKPVDQLNEDDRAALFDYFLATTDAVFQEKLIALRSLRDARSAAIDGIQEIMVMQEMDERRPTHRLERGAYDAPREEVLPGTPARLLPFDEAWPRNRLGLAMWLTDARHPLTARVAVNRFWQALYGRGLVATPEDFGSQGALPTHPELLDWLAKSFIDSGWDVKALMKTIVMSATYRQSTVASPELRERDPLNELLAHGASYRWSAEMIRDQALFSSGLLVNRMGGPPVKPYQPPGLWEEKSGATYTRDEGEGSHRRSLYTYWKRTSQPPAMITLDAAQREVCVVKRQVTSTPLQALLLLNDPQYVEAARGLAERTLVHGGTTLEERSNYLFRLLTSRYPTEAEQVIVTSFFTEERDHYSSQPEAAAELLAVGDHRHPADLDQTELAAWTVVVLTLLSHDEVVRRQ